MSIDDLYGERSYIRGKITACEYKIGELKKLKKRHEDDIKDLEEDKRRINNIIKNMSNIPPLLNTANSNIIGAKDSVAGYYYGSKTEGWKGRLKLASNLTRGIKSSFDSIKTKGDTTIGEIDKEIRKLQDKIEECEKNIESSEDDLKGYERDLEDVQWEIDHYYDEEDD